jgi:DNA-binding IclR family transcriptional regulator
MAKAARVLQQIQAHPPISERDLQRNTNMRADEVRLVVEHLIHLGQVRYRQEDDLIEPVPARQQAGN